MQTVKFKTNLTVPSCDQFALWRAPLVSALPINHSKFWYLLEIQNWVQASFYQYNWDVKTLLIHVTRDRNIRWHFSNSLVYRFSYSEMMGHQGNQIHFLDILLLMIFSYQSGSLRSRCHGCGSLVEPLPCMCVCGCVRGAHSFYSQHCKRKKNKNINHKNLEVK